MERHLSEATENMDISMFSTLGVITAILSQHSGHTPTVPLLCKCHAYSHFRDPCVDPQCLSGGLYSSAQRVIVRARC